MTTLKEPNQSPTPASGAMTTQRKVLYAVSAFAAIGAAVAGSAAVSAHPRAWQHGDFMAAMVEHRVESLLSEVDATDEQKAQISSILGAAAADVHTLRDQHRQAHTELQSILAAENVDRSQLENLRMQHLALADDASKRITVALADAADVLTPEQRVELTQKLEQYRRWHHHEE